MYLQPAFLAMANVNALTAGSTGKGYTKLTSNVRKLSFENSAKHTETDVYFTVSGTETVSAESKGKLTEFYDMYGNMLDIAENDGVFSIDVTTEPIYAVTYYKDKLDVSVTYKFGTLTVSGNVYTSHKDEILTIKVFDDKNKLIYINQTALDENLLFKFNFVPLGESAIYAVKLGNASFDEIHSAEYTIPKVNDEISVSASRNFNKITLSGTVKKALKDENVTVKVFDSDGSIIYVNQAKTAAKGGFEFEFVPLKTSDVYVFYIANKSLSEIFSVNFDGETFTGIKLKALSNSDRVFNLSDYNSADTVTVSVDNDGEVYDGDFTVAVASYKGDALTEIEMIEKGDMLFDGSVYRYDIHNKISNADKVKIFLFNSFSNIKPLTYSVELK